MVLSCIWGLSVVITAHLIVITTIKKGSVLACDMWTALNLQTFVLTLRLNFFALVRGAHFCLVLLGSCACELQQRWHPPAYAQRERVKVSDYDPAQRHPIKTLQSLHQEFTHSSCRRSFEGRPTPRPEGCSCINTAPNTLQCGCEEGRSGKHESPDSISFIIKSHFLWRDLHKATSKNSHSWLCVAIEFEGHESKT